MFYIDLVLCYHRGLNAHLLNLEVGPVSRTSKRFSFYLSHCWPASLFLCHRSDPVIPCPMVLAPPEYRHDGLEQVPLLYSSAVELQRSPLCHFPQSASKCPSVARHGRQVSYQV